MYVFHKYKNKFHYMWEYKSLACELVGGEC